MSELNEQVTVLVEDASVITVPIDTTLSNSGEAADAKAVGAALALKADASSVTGITVNGESADQQGAILIDGSDIPVSSGDNTKIDAALSALDAKDAATIIYDGAESIKEHVDAMDDNVVHLDDLSSPTGITPTINSTNLEVDSNDCCVIGSMVFISICVTAKVNIAARSYTGITLPKPKNAGNLSSNATLAAASNTNGYAYLLGDGRIYNIDAIASSTKVAFTFAYPSTTEEIAPFITA